MILDEIVEGLDAGIGRQVVAAGETHGEIRPVLVGFAEIAALQDPARRADGMGAPVAADRRLRAQRGEAIAQPVVARPLDVAVVAKPRFRRDGRAEGAEPDAKGIEIRPWAVRDGLAALDLPARHRLCQGEAGQQPCPERRNDPPPPCHHARHSGFERSWGGASTRPGTIAFNETTSPLTIGSYLYENTRDPIHAKRVFRAGDRDRRTDRGRRVGRCRRTKSKHSGQRRKPKCWQMRAAPCTAPQKRYVRTPFRTV